MLFSPVFAKLRQRLDHQPALTRPDLLSVRLIQGISFQSITHSFARRPTAIPFPFNHFHTLFIVTEGVPSCLSDFAQFWCNLSPFRINTSRPPRKCCKQKTYSLSKLFRCNTYKKHGGGDFNVSFSTSLHHNFLASSLHPLVVGPATGLRHHPV